MKRLLKRDGHIHTPFCPHGSKDPLNAYVEEALRLGKETISFTEHFPLPDDFRDVAFRRACSLLWEEVPDYLAAIEKVKKAYEGRIRIYKGFEIDYLEGKEMQLKQDLARIGEQIEDSILSVHIIRWQDVYYDIDLEDEFQCLLEKIDSVEKIYDLYFETVLKSVTSDLGGYKPKRIGHPTLVRIFNKKYPTNYEPVMLYHQILDEMKMRGLAIDYNVAGLRKVFCGETYPSGLFLSLAKEKQISFVIGSDAHEVKHMALTEELLKLI